MIFTPNHIEKILSGTKTQTRRINKTNEFFGPDGDTEGVYIYDEHGNSRLKWEIGRTYAVTPGRGKYAPWWQQTENGRETQQIGVGGWEHKDELENAGYRQMRIRITNIRPEWLQDITNADAMAEGCSWTAGFESNDWDSYRHFSPQNSYRRLWDSINKAHGTRWEDNPPVWALEFELVE